MCNHFHGYVRRAKDFADPGLNYAEHFIIEQTHPIFPICWTSFCLCSLRSFTQSGRWHCPELWKIQCIVIRKTNITIIVCWEILTSEKLPEIPPFLSSDCQFSSALRLVSVLAEILTAKPLNCWMNCQISWLDHGWPAVCACELELLPSPLSIFPPHSSPMYGSDQTKVC